MRMCYTHRRWFSTLITNLVQEGKKDKALKALEKCETEIPAYNVPHDPIMSSSLEIAEAYIACDKPEKAKPILEAIEKNSIEYIKWYLSLSNVYFANSTRDCHQEIFVLASVQDLYSKMGTSEADKKAQKMEDELQRLYSAFVTKCEGAGIQLQ
jgi:predicted Zn-dependent protease